MNGGGKLLKRLSDATIKQRRCYIERSKLLNDIEQAASLTAQNNRLAHSLSY